MKIAILIIITITLLWNLFLRICNLRSTKNEIPENVKDIYDEETYRKWKNYYKEKITISVIHSLFDFVVGICLIIFNVYTLFDLEGFFVPALLVTLFDIVVNTVISIPMNYRNTFKIEEKYGFNKCSKKTFVSDEIKNFVIKFVLMVGLVSIYMLSHQKLGDKMIFLFVGVIIVFDLLIGFLSPVLVKIFNKLTSLEEGELRDKLSDLLTKNGYSVRDIKVMDESKRSTRANAMFSGFGKSKTIILYDNLVNNFTPDEICAVFAHEMGHGMHKDTLKMQFISFILICVLGIGAWLLVRYDSIYFDFGFTKVNYGFALIMMGALMGFLTPLFGLISNALSRYAEYRADKQAVIEGYGDELINALKKLTKLNFRNLAPFKINVLLEYSHPTTSQRIDAIKKAQKRISK